MEVKQSDSKSENKEMGKGIPDACTCCLYQA